MLGGLWEDRGRAEEDGKNGDELVKIHYFYE